MENSKLLSEQELGKVSSGVNITEGISNPMSVPTVEEALEIAQKLDEGKDMGTWKTMTGAEYMRLWYSVHNQQNVK